MKYPPMTAYDWTIVALLLTAFVLMLLKIRTTKDTKSTKPECDGNCRYQMVRAKRSWVPEWLFALLASPLDLIVIRWLPFRYLLTAPCAIVLLLLGLGGLNGLGAQTVGVQYSQTTNSSGQIILTPVSTNSEAPSTVVSTVVSGLPSVSVTNDTFIQSFMAYFTAFNTNSTTFGTNAPLEIFTGVKFQSGISLGALLGLEWQPLSSANWLTLRDVATFADAVGTISENEFDVGAFMVHYDLRFGAFVGIDTQIAINRWEGIVGIEAQKALTANTFAGIALERRLDNGSRGALTVFIETGATF